MALKFVDKSSLETVSLDLPVKLMFFMNLPSIEHLYFYWDKKFYKLLKKLHYDNLFQKHHKIP